MLSTTYSFLFLAESVLKLNRRFANISHQFISVTECRGGKKMYH